MSLEPDKIKALLIDSNKVHVEKYIAHLKDLEAATDNNGKLKNPWLKHRTSTELANYFKRIEAINLEFDGKHITLQSTGISMDYIACKNKVLLVYPETKITHGLVYKDDDYNFYESDFKVKYHINHAKPFDARDEDIIGAYCIISNKRGEFLKTLDKDQIAKHRKAAKTDMIWKGWFGEMVLKTVIKKCCKTCLDDVLDDIEAIDNDNIDLDQPIDVDLGLKDLVEQTQTIEALTALYNDKKPSGDDIKLFTARKEAIKAELKKQQEQKTNENN